MFLYYSLWHYWLWNHLFWYKNGFHNTFDNVNLIFISFIYCIILLATAEGITILILDTKRGHYWSKFPDYLLLPYLNCSKSCFSNMLVFKVVWDTEFNADGSTYLCHIQNIRFSNLILSIYNMQLSKIFQR